MHEIDSLLKTRWLGRYYHHYEKTASTNTIAYELAEQGAPTGTVICADAQTSGRGRRGRKWDSPQGGLWFSLLLRPAISPKEAAALTAVTAVGLCRGLLYYPGVGAKIKWPNDIYADGKKCGGILSEMKVTENKLDYVVIGVGLDLSSAELEEELRPFAVGIEELYGSDIDRGELLCRLLLGLESAYDQFLNGQSEILFEEWKEQALDIGREVKIRTVNGSVSGRPVGLADDGFLLLDIGGGKGAKIISGDIVAEDSSAEE